MEPEPQPPLWRTLLAEEHLGLMLTLSYLLLTLIGLSYEFWFFRYFRITIVEYVETSDFLLAAVREPLVIVLAVLPLFLIRLYLRLERWLGQRIPAFGRWSNRWNSGPSYTPAVRQALWTLCALIYAFVFIQLYAERVTDRIKAGQGREVRIELASGAPPASRALLLGTTAKFVFLYVPAEKQTQIIPIDNVSRLVVSSEKRRR
ncbi:MAG: hypothetical protein ABUT39_03190 [Acidobacteriota bacterium]